MGAQGFWFSFACRFLVKQKNIAMQYSKKELGFTCIHIWSLVVWYTSELFEYIFTDLFLTYNKNKHAICFCIFASSSFQLKPSRIHTFLLWYTILPETDNLYLHVDIPHCCLEMIINFICSVFDNKNDIVTNPCCESYSRSEACAYNLYLDNCNQGTANYGSK